MESVLPEWYGPDENAVRSMLEEGTIALDANVMLDLYRVGRDQREQILSTFAAVKDRLFVPYQAALEFQRNRLTVASKTQKLFDQLPERLRVNINHLADIHDPNLKREIKELADTAASELQAQIKSLWEKHMIPYREIARQDPVRAALDDLLQDERIGKRPTDERLVELRAVAEQRIADKLPPGYKDSDKTPEKKVGDYLVWAELLAHHENSARPLLFISRDEKEDWYEMLNGERIGPRIELRAEMRGVSPSHPYHHMGLARFLELAKQHLGVQVDDATIETVEDIARDAEEADRVASAIDTVARNAAREKLLKAARMGFRSAVEQNPDVQREFYKKLRIPMPGESWQHLDFTPDLTGWREIGLSSISDSINKLSDENRSALFEGLIDSESRSIADWVLSDYRPIMPGEGIRLDRDEANDRDEDEGDGGPVGAPLVTS